jgi:hypothetical protein
MGLTLGRPQHFAGSHRAAGPEKVSQRLSVAFAQQGNCNRPVEALKPKLNAVRRFFLGFTVVRRLAGVEAKLIARLFIEDYLERPINGQSGPSQSHE